MAGFFRSRLARDGLPFIGFMVALSFAATSFTSTTIERRDEARYVSRETLEAFEHDVASKKKLKERRRNEYANNKAGGKALTKAMDRQASFDLQDEHDVRQEVQRDWRARRQKHATFPVKYVISPLLSSVKEHFVEDT